MSTVQVRAHGAERVVGALLFGAAFERVDVVEGQAYLVAPAGTSRPVRKRGRVWVRRTRAEHDAIFRLAAAFAAPLVRIVPADAKDPLLALADAGYPGHSREDLAALFTVCGDSVEPGHVRQMAVNVIRWAAPRFRLPFVLRLVERVAVELAQHDTLTAADVRRLAGWGTFDA